MKTNARLLKQSAEKDDMNAKSLSTILHLKNLTEQLTQGKASLEQQLKSAGQLSLAARLATNAKDRVAEEVIKEKEVGYYFFQWLFFYSNSPLDRITLLTRIFLEFTGN